MEHLLDLKLIYFTSTLLQEAVYELQSIKNEFTSDSFYTLCNTILQHYSTSNATSRRLTRYSQQSSFS